MNNIELTLHLKEVAQLYDKCAHLSSEIDKLQDKINQKVQIQKEKEQKLREEERKEQPDYIQKKIQKVTQVEVKRKCDHCLKTFLTDIDLKHHLKGVAKYQRSKARKLKQKNIEKALSERTDIQKPNESKAQQINEDQSNDDFEIYVQL